MKTNQSQQANQPLTDNGVYDPASGHVIDGETGEVLDAEENPDRLAEELFGSGDGPQSDGTTILPKITMATIRAMPERAKIADRPMKIALITGIAGGENLMPPIDREAEFLAMPEDDVRRMVFSALVASLEPWGAVRFGDDGEPEAVFKSDFLFLPISHNAVLQRLRKYGQVPIAFELWAQPSNNVRGYSWTMYNLAKYDNNISPIDRLLKLGVKAGKMRQMAGATGGLLADLRND